MKYLGLKWALCVGLFLPSAAFASVTITEINFNPDGSDSGYEWIEVLVEGNNISLDEWKFREADVNHGLRIPDNESFTFIVEKGNYFLIVDNPEKFKEEFPHYDGIYFDSSFSLSNSGESLSLLDPGLIQQYEITYDPAWLGENTIDGATLSLMNDVWIAGNPTPGSNNEQASQQQSEEIISSSIDTPSDISGNEKTPEEIEYSKPTYISLSNNFDNVDELRAQSGGNRTVIAGASHTYTGEAYGLVGGKLRNPEFIWNFGDGNSIEKNPAKHSYQYPGTYLAHLKVKSSSYIGRDWFEVEVINSPLTINVDLEDGSILLENTSKYVLDISDYQIQFENNIFRFPEDSFISGNNSIRLSKNQISFDIKEGNYALRYPNDEKIYSHLAETQPPEQNEKLEGQEDKQMQDPVSIAEISQSEPAKLEVITSETLVKEIKRPQLGENNFVSQIINTDPKGEKESPAVSSQAAQLVPSNLQSSEINLNLPLVVMVLVGLGAGGLFFLQKRTLPTTTKPEKQNQADDFEIQ